MRKLFITSFILVAASQAEEDSIQCSSECGLYSENDKIGPHLHQQCYAFDEKCPQVLEDIKKKRRKARKSKSGVRVVGGEAHDHPMPWMAFIVTEDRKEETTEMCGGTLINSQWIITAAHCFCRGFCTRVIESISDEPMKIKDDVNIKETIKVYLGLTEVKDRVYKWIVEAKLWDENPKEVFHEVENVFIHPKLGTSEEHIMNPDLALIQLAKPVPKFTDMVRPICLPKQHPEGKQTCPDNSVESDVDKIGSKPRNTKKWIKTKRDSNRMLGGCGTVAGWGLKHDGNFYANYIGTCTTDDSNAAPSRNQKCAEYWKLSENDQRKDFYSCTTQDMKPKDIDIGCDLLYRELRFQKMIKSNKYQNLDLNDMVNKLDAPVELHAGEKVFHCSKTDFTKEREDPKWRGWCATKNTKENGEDRIQSWGMCAKTCYNESNAFSFANMNLLLDEECAYLDKNVKDDRPSGINFKTEFCAGHKSNFPNAFTTLKRRKKNKKERKKDKRLAKKAGVTMKPTEYAYKNIQEFKKRSLEVPDDYPYKWYLGGVDTCQGDSGGPLWTNFEEDGKARATILGVVSRGSGCAAFNAPAIYGSVSKNLDWIQEIVLKESKDKDKFCPGEEIKESKKNKKNKKNKKGKKSKKSKKKNKKKKKSKKSNDYMDDYYSDAYKTSETATFNDQAEPSRHIYLVKTV